MHKWVVVTSWDYGKRRKFAVSNGRMFHSRNRAEDAAQKLRDLVKKDPENYMRGFSVEVGYVNWGIDINSA